MTTFFAGLLQVYSPKIEGRKKLTLFGQKCLPRAVVPWPVLAPCELLIHFDLKLTNKEVWGFVFPVAYCWVG